MDWCHRGWMEVSLQENHLGRGMRVAWGLEMVGFGVREGTTLAWVCVSTWLNTGTPWQHVQCRPKDHPPQPEQPWGGGPGALAGCLPAACLPACLSLSFVLCCLPAPPPPARQRQHMPHTCD